MSFKQRLMNDHRIVVTGTISVNDTTGIGVYAGMQGQRKVAIKFIPDSLSEQAIREMKVYELFDDNRSQM
ncbi:hypothetical protein TSUD_182600 [Trifolium subterraneum]|uniref:Uncharacterized protein n=1 Tax=Trifolium subterraneum TaxID=3900 RepID=A0A2Z6LKH4_TRISU|nr:hypothetical protein TSUD_182600 [Trifolium subterraneum]